MKENGKFKKQEQIQLRKLRGFELQGTISCKKSSLKLTESQAIPVRFENFSSYRREKTENSNRIGIYMRSCYFFRDDYLYYRV